MPKPTSRGDFDAVGRQRPSEWPWCFLQAFRRPTLSKEMTRPAGRPTSRSVWTTPSSVGCCGVSRTVRPAVPMPARRPRNRPRRLPARHLPARPRPVRPGLRTRIRPPRPGPRIPPRPLPLLWPLRRRRPRHPPRPPHRQQRRRTSPPRDRLPRAQRPKVPRHHRRPPRPQTHPTVQRRTEWGWTGPLERDPGQEQDGAQKRPGRSPGNRARNPSPPRARPPLLTKPRPAPPLPPVIPLPLPRPPPTTR